jgi:transcriptional regulator with XRE-family HTH domain
MPQSARRFMPFGWTRFCEGVRLMGVREAFGPNLRRLRIQRGITLEQIADQTKVSVDLWKGLERNDFGRWPSGIYARAYVRSYAEAVGVDGDETVDEFCRNFPQGDRRVARLVREQAAIVGHSDLVWGDEAGGRTVERRASGGVPPRPLTVPERIGSIVGRLVGAVERGVHFVQSGAVREVFKRHDVTVPTRKHHREI